MMTMNKFKMTLACIGLTCALASPLTMASSATQNWQPTSSEKLVKMPANIIERRISQDFSQSPMAKTVVNNESGMVQSIERMSQIKEQLENLEGDEKKAKRHEFLEVKSHYLDLLQENLALNQQMLDKKQSLYQKVLSKMRNKKQNDANTYELRETQKAARSRMDKMLEKVDQMMLNEGYAQDSKYATQYQANLSSIEQLKKAIVQHQANLVPSLNGVEVSSEEFIRQMLMNIQGEQALHDQQKVIMSYMAKLVALDAQALEYEISYDTDESLQSNEEVTPAKVTNLFL